MWFSSSFVAFWPSIDPPSSSAHARANGHPVRHCMIALGPAFAGTSGLKSFLLQRALRIEIADTAALAAGCRVDHCIDESRLAGIHRRVDRALHLIRGRRIDADAAESLHQLVVARPLDENGRRRVRAGVVDVGAPIDAVIVEDNDANRQLVSADRLDLHAGETERAVALDRQYRLAGLDSRGDRIAHTDTHDAPGTDVQTLARLVHIDDAACEVE